MSVNKYVISFDEKEYNEQMDRLELYLEAWKSLKDEITALVGQIEIDYDDPMLSVREAFLKKYEDKNTFGLSFQKLIELLEIDLSRLKDAIALYEKCQVRQKPQREDFTIYAKTEEQKARLRLANGLLRNLETIKENGWGHCYAGVFVQSFSAPPIFMNGSLDWKVNPRFVLNDVR